MGRWSQPSCPLGTLVGLGAGPRTGLGPSSCREEESAKFCTVPGAKVAKLENSEALNTPLASHPHYKTFVRSWCCIRPEADLQALR